ncbi:predicted protein [Streptomyces sp. SPB78]|nr:predicted protein [Streptomyces sp. SPB78]
MIAARVTEAHARLAGLAHLRGDLKEAAEQHARGARVAEEAALTWYAVDAHARLSELSLHLGDVETGVRSARAALAHGAPHADAAAHTRLRLLLADALARNGQDEEAAEHALEATHWADSVPQGEGLAAWARFRLGGLLLGQGRVEEAAVILEAALTGLDAERHGDGAVVQARWWLGDCHRRLGEPREAAEAYLLAAELAQHWPEQRDHAVLANLAADALGDAGLREGAERAYARAGELWLDVGNPLARVRTLRARAWLHAADESDDATERALAFMVEATSVGETLLTEPPFAEVSEARSQAYAELAPYVRAARRDPRRHPGGRGRQRRRRRPRRGDPRRTGGSARPRTPRDRRLRHGGPRARPGAKRRAAHGGVVLRRARPRTGSSRPRRHGARDARRRRVPRRSGPRRGSGTGPGGDERRSAGRKRLTPTRRAYRTAV